MKHDHLFIEDAATRVYLVGGAVRDRLLDLPVRERDWVVTGATEHEMLERGFLPKAHGFPVFTHPDTGEEYALARRERKVGTGHRGFVFDAGPDVSLDEDLARRDLTVNAIAQASDGRFVDPYGGLADLEARRLRHVTAAFVEDPLRVLRLARFAARLAVCDFDVDPETVALAVEMSRSPDLQTLSAGRIWRELEKALGTAHPGAFLHWLERFGALERLMPWTSPPEHTLRGEPARALARAADRSQDLAVRLSAMLTAAAIAGASARPPADWPLPAAARDLAAVCVQHPPPVDADAPSVLAWLETVDAWRRRERFTQMLTALEAACPLRADGLARLCAARDAARGARPARGAADPAGEVRAQRLDRIRTALAGSE